MDNRQTAERYARQIDALWPAGAAVCLTIGLNLPGGSQVYPFSDDLATAASQAVEVALADRHLKLNAIQHALDEDAPFWLATTAPEIAAGDLKRLLAQVEQQHPLGRLFDLDVLVAGQGPLTRADLGLPPRVCLVCREAAQTCRRLGGHDAAELRAAVLRLVTRYDPATFARLTGNGYAVSLLAADIAAKVTAGLLLEAACWPSPGLVSPVDGGGHTDMALPTFLLSGSVLSPGFAILAALGNAGADQAPQASMPRLRAAGYLFEQRMLLATGGVNTHRGYLFLGGLAAAAAGRLAAGKGLSCLRAGDLPADELAAAVSALSEELVRNELQNGAGSPRALNLYRVSGLTGPRGEAEAGLPSVLQLGLPALRQALQRGLSLNDALVHTLLTLIAQVGDTALAGRHQAATLRELVWPAARSALAAGSVFTAEGRAAILALAREFASRRINPGGSADLLALTAAVHLLEQGKWPAGAELAKSLFAR